MKSTIRRLPGSHGFISLPAWGSWMSSTTCLCHRKRSSKVRRLDFSTFLNVSFCETTVISFASVAVGDKVMKDIRPGVPFEPTYIYKLLTLIKSSLSEKVSPLITVLMAFRGLIKCLDIFENVCVRDPYSLSREVWWKRRNVWIYHTQTFFQSDYNLKVRSL